MGNLNHPATPSKIPKKVTIHLDIANLFGNPSFANYERNPFKKPVDKSFFLFRGVSTSVCWNNLGKIWGKHTNFALILLPCRARIVNGVNEADLLRQQRRLWFNTEKGVKLLDIILGMKYLMILWILTDHLCLIIYKKIYILNLNDIHISETHKVNCCHLKKVLLTRCAFPISPMFRVNHLGLLFVFAFLIWARSEVDLTWKSKCLRKKWVLLHLEFLPKAGVMSKLPLCLTSTYETKSYFKPVLSRFRKIDCNVFRFFLIKI